MTSPHWFQRIFFFQKELAEKIVERYAAALHFFENAVKRTGFRQNPPVERVEELERKQEEALEKLRAITAALERPDDYAVYAQKGEDEMEGAKAYAKHHPYSVGIGFYYLSALNCFEAALAKARKYFETNPDEGKGVISSLERNVQKVKKLLG